MCGIIGYIGSRDATEVILDGLKRLEYRGYDSAGLAVFDGREIEIVRAEGKLKNLEKKLTEKPVKGSLGIGHTRWATHGRPTETNAHPHRSGPVILVHNGIIENHAQLEACLTRNGHAMESETDTEIVCHLIQQGMNDGLSMRDAFRKALSKIEGSYALVVMNQDEPDRLYVARKGSPLVIGLGEGEAFVASDVAPLLSYTRNVVFLEDLDWGEVRKDGFSIRDGKGLDAHRPVKVITWNRTMAEKGGFKHFMLKEIFEQPRSVADTLSDRVSEMRHQVLLNGVERLFQGVSYEKIYIIACGTSYHAGLYGKYVLEEMSKSLVIVDQASEFRYRSSPVDEKTLVIAVSQSGETADTLAAISECHKRGAKVLSICNVVDASIPRQSDETIYTRAGPEIGVASTKAFTTQLTVLLLLSLYLGRLQGHLDGAFLREALHSLVRVPDQMETLLKKSGDVARLAKTLIHHRDFLYLGRGVGFPTALEGALKLKEISYIHAEGYAAGEMKHGPIALIDEDVPVVVVIPRDRSYEKTLSNVQEVMARGAKVIAVGTEGDVEVREKAHAFIGLPEVPWYIYPLLSSIPLQLLAYYIADFKGTDVDQPRNLAKSVTVE